MLQEPEDPAIYGYGDRLVWLEPTLSKTTREVQHQDEGSDLTAGRGLIIRPHTPAFSLALPSGGPDPVTIDLKVSELNTSTNTFLASRAVEISTPAADGHLDPFHGLIWGMEYPDGFGRSDIYRTERIVSEEDLTKSWSTPINAGPGINTEYEETMPSATSDGSRLYFMSDRPGGQGGMDIYRAVNEAAD